MDERAFLEMTVFAPWKIVATKKQRPERLYDHWIMIAHDDLSKLQSLYERLFGPSKAFDFERIRPLPEGLTFPDELSFYDLYQKTLDWALDRRHGSQDYPEESLSRFCYMVNDAAACQGFRSILHWMKAMWDVVGPWRTEGTAIYQKPTEEFRSFSFEFKLTSPSFFIHYLIEQEFIVYQRVCRELSVWETDAWHNNPYEAEIETSEDFVRAINDMGYRMKATSGHRDYTNRIYIEEDWENASPARKNFLSDREFVEKLFCHWARLYHLPPRNDPYEWHRVLMRYAGQFAKLFFGDTRVIAKKEWIEGMPESVWQQIVHRRSDVYFLRTSDKSHGVHS